MQGVGFRYNVREIACGYEVAGYVRNRHGGRVELAAEGAEEEVTAFLEAVRASQLGSHIRNEDAKWEQAAGEFRGFDIRY